VPAGIAAVADRVWRDDEVFPRAEGTETTLSTREIPGGPLVLLRHLPDGRAAPLDRRDAWQRGLVWLRLGLSEGLLDTCVSYLDSRTSGDASLLHQQMVRGSIAEVLIEGLEVHAVLTADEPAELAAAGVAHLQEQITLADRALLRLLGASGFIAGGPGEVAYLSELLAEAYACSEECG
jgi:hypothetical protein